MRAFLLSILLCLGLCFPAWARRDSGQDWRQLATEHFLVIYPEIAAGTAAQAAAVAEEYYPKVKALTGYAPAGRTPIVLNAFQDSANGYTMPVYHKLEFYLATPTGKWDGTLNRSWLESLMVHEFTHLCYGTRAEGFSLGLAWIFGGIHDLNLIAPGWWTEGVAEYAETELTAGGRGRNPYHRMKLAANLLSEQPWSLGQIGNAPAYDFPFDRTYVAGYDLVNTLAETVKDPEFLDRASAAQSAWPFFGIGFVWSNTFQQNLGSLFERRWAELRQVFALQYGPERTPAPESRVVAADRHAAFSQPCWADNQRLAAFCQDLNRGPRLVQWDIRTGERQDLARPALLTGTLGYAPAERAYYYARLLPGPWDDHSLTADLFRLDARGERRLTFGGRCWSPDVSADGRLVCVSNRCGSTQLAVADKAGGDLRPVPAVAGATYLSPRWSPDGRWLAAAVGLAGRQDVCLVDPASGTLTALCGWDPAGDHDPCWSPDGRRIFFVSDRSGVDQIYAFNLETRELFQVTDARLGVFEPAVSPDGKLMAFAEYCPGNFQRLVVAPVEPGQWKPAVLPAPRAQPATPEEFLLPPARGCGYSAWTHLLPTFWLPLVSEDRDGLLLGGFSARQDPLAMHAWQAQALVQPKTGRWYGEAAYANEETFLILSGRIFSRPLSQWGEAPDGQAGQLCWARSQGFELNAGLPVNGFRSEDRCIRLLASLGYTAFELSELASAADGDRQAAAAVFPDAGYAGLKAGLWYSDVRQAVRDLFPTAGIEIDLEGRRALPGHGYDGSLFSATAVASLPSCFAHQAFKLGARGQALQGLFPAAPDAVYPAGYASLFRAKSRALTLSAAYAFPLWPIDQGPGLVPLFFHSLWGEAFAEWGCGWNGSLQPGEWSRRAVTSLGLAAHLDIEMLWCVPGRLSQSLARKQDGSWIVDLNLALGI